MIKVNTNTCCGCSACAQNCPKGCISMRPDVFDGFLYPFVDMQICVDCGLCEKVCPVHSERRSPIAVEALAVKNENTDVLSKSSSGGVFSLLAEKVLADGGVVFGARFTDNWQVVIDYTETVEALAPFRGSKYVQASTRTSYKDARRFLEAGRIVLFSGTPCQIAGLKSFLGREYDNLLAVDVICHGVPSPWAWTRYLEEFNDVSSVNFRDKVTGWKQYSVSIGQYCSPYFRDLYMNAFLCNLILRKCCSDCHFKSGRSGSDVTLGDFWGIEMLDANLDNDKGINCVVINTSKGNQLCDCLDVLRVFPIQVVYQMNPSYCSPSPHNVNRDYFFRLLNKYSFSQSFFRTTSMNVWHRLNRVLFRFLSK